MRSATFTRTCNVCATEWQVTRRQARVSPGRRRRPRPVSPARHGGRGFDFADSARRFEATLETRQAYRRCPGCGVDDFTQQRGATRMSGWVAAVLAAVSLAGCAASHSPTAHQTVHFNQSLSQPAGTRVHGGTVTWAQLPGNPPNDIFPIETEADYTNANGEEFSQLLYRPLYWYGQDGRPTVDFDKSVGRPPVFTDHDRVVSVRLNHYRWSDGETVDARDIVFFMNVMKAEKENYGGYVPGFFPDNIVATTAPDGPTGTLVRFRLTRTVNPTWFLYNELSQITPMPIAWDRTSLRAPAPPATAAHLPDTTPAGARAVYGFLNGQSQQLTTYASSRVWRIVDAPWRLAAFSSDGAATFVPNPDYVGPDHPYLAKFVEEPFTSDTAEFDTLQAGGGRLQVGYVPAQSVPELPSVERRGYRALTVYAFGLNFLPLNFHSREAGAMLRQLYVRQALQHLIDQRGWDRAYFAGLATPLYGPVPVAPANPFADALEKSDPYAFDPATSRRLLSEHGWAVRRGGTTTCAQPARCGAGIHRGEALSLHLDVASGSISVDSSMDDFVADAALAGIQVHVAQQPYNTVVGEAIPGNTAWDFVNYGTGDSWTFGPDYYASGEELFTTGAANNDGAYSDRETDRLIAATTSVGEHGSQRTLDEYENDVIRKLPVLFQPQQATEVVEASDLGGTEVNPNTFDNLDPESWYLVKPSR